MNQNYFKIFIPPVCLHGWHINGERYNGAIAAIKQVTAHKIPLYLMDILKK